MVHRRADDPAPDDPFRGLYLTDEVVDQLLTTAQKPPPPDLQAATGGSKPTRTPPISGGASIRLRRLAPEAGLTELDVEMLIICAGARPGQPVRAALRLPQR